METSNSLFDGKVVLSDSRIYVIQEFTQSGKLSLVVCYLCVSPES